MRYTLLELVQHILSSMDSDEVDSITDTEEAQQVVYALKQTYYDLVNLADLPAHKTAYHLTASTVDTPTLMTLPETYNSLEWLKYDARTADGTEAVWQDVTAVDLKDFLRVFLPQTDDAVTDPWTYTTQNGQEFAFWCRTDTAPRYYTTLDDSVVIFDAYDSAVDASGLQSSKTMAYGEQNYTWSDIDTFVPPLDDKQFSILLNEAKALCWAELKQAQHTLALQSARRGWINMQRTKDKIKVQTALDLAPKFGRRP